VRAVAPLDRAGAGDLSFIESPKYASLFTASQAAVTLVAASLADAPGPAVLVIVDDPREALLALLPRLYAPPPRNAGVDSTARIGRGVRLPPDATIEPYVVIGDGASLGARAWIGAQCVVGQGVSAGDDLRLFPAVTLHSGTQVGHRVTIHAGARIGNDGFGYVFRDGEHAKIPHVGRCVIGDDVEIGANTAIDRGSLDDTIVGAGTKIDNLVHIAHNVRVGRLCLIMAQVGIAGSARLNDGCILAGQVGVSGHLTIGAGARLAGQAGVFGNVPPGETWSGYPARPHATALRAQAALFRLPRLLRAIERLIGAKELPDARSTILEGDA
jgi:UDP-3-O-[3-hydroxymyristoyl] glucosamine N-acyltransferase